MSSRSENVFKMRFHGGPKKGPIAHPTYHEGGGSKGGRKKDSGDKAGVARALENRAKKANTFNEIIDVLNDMRKAKLNKTVPYIEAVQKASKLNPGQTPVGFYLD